MVVCNIFMKGSATPYIDSRVKQSLGKMMHAQIHNTKHLHF